MKGGTMKTSIAISLLLICVGCAAQDKNVAEPSATVIEERSPAGQPLAGVDAVVVKVTTKVKSVDLATRHVTLIGPEGEALTVKAGEHIQRLDEVKPGDAVVVDYLQAVAFEVRPPTAEEKANPTVMGAGAARAEKSMAPAAAVAGIVRSIVTISKIDKKAGTVTVTLPGGRTETIKAKHPENLERIKVGDTAAVSYTEAVGLNLVPAGKK
jgi:hypothetical protein